MPETVVGRFQTRGEAESALRKLGRGGLTSNDIDIVAPRRRRGTLVDAGRARPGRGNGRVNEVHRVEPKVGPFSNWGSLASNGRASPPNPS